MKLLNTTLAFLPVKSVTHAYLVKKYITNNKYLTPRFLKNKDPISAKSTAQISSLNLV